MTSDDPSATGLLDHLLRSMRGGRKLLVPYLMAGVPDARGFARAYEAVAVHSDSVEIGLPFSDPLMDGPVIAAAADRAIRSGTGPYAGLSLADALPDLVPRLAMTYYNPIHNLGEPEFCERAAGAGMKGLIVPDLPLEESHGLRQSAAEAGLAWIPLVAPTSSPSRVAEIVATATGFVYAVSTLGVTGTRGSLSARAGAVVRACREHTDLPILVGIGVSNAEQAVEAAVEADGVIVGSAVIKLLVETSPAEAGVFVEGLRKALDGV